MVDMTKYHINEQQADALLAPVRADLLVLERRMRHYVERMRLSADDQDALRATEAALARARGIVDRVYAESAARARGEEGTA